MRHHKIVIQRAGDSFILKMRWDVTSKSKDSKWDHTTAYAAKYDLLYEVVRSIDPDYEYRLVSKEFFDEAIRLSANVKESIEVNKS